MLTIPNPIRTPVIMRSRLKLEVASELVAANEWAEKQTMIYFRVQGASEWKIRFFASDAPGSVAAVAKGEPRFSNLQSRRCSRAGSASPRSVARQAAAVALDHGDPAIRPARL